jgi:type IX secretion system PorP/SprF family membrane protein
MKYLYTLSLFAAVGWGCLQAQQPAQYSMFMMNQLNWNPAYAGLDHSLSITGMFRKQWVDLEGSPATQYLSAHMPLYLVNGGVGLNVENDVLGAGRFTSATLSYNYQLFMGSGILSLGVGGGLVQRQIDGAKLRTPDGNYNEPGAIDHQDDLLPLGSESGAAPTFNAGIYFQGKRLEAGFGVRNLAETSLDLVTFGLQLKRNYFFTFGLNFDIGRSLTLHPSVMVRSDVIQTQTDVAAIIRYNDNIFGGVSFRGYNSQSIDAMAFMAGFKLSENLTLAYAYDLTLSDIRLVSNGSHEIMVNYNLNKRLGAGKPPRIIYNPRSL